MRVFVCFVSFLYFISRLLWDAWPLAWSLPEWSLLDLQATIAEKPGVLINLCCTTIENHTDWTWTLHRTETEICSYSAGKLPGHASRCLEVIQAQCLDDDTEQAQLLGVLGGDVSAVRSATGAGLCDTWFMYPVKVAVSAKCSDSLSLWMRSNPPKIFLKRGNTHTLFQFIQNRDRHI